jgi:hypothetical protein
MAENEMSVLVPANAVPPNTLTSQWFLAYTVSINKTHFGQHIDYKLPFFFFIHSIAIELN